MDVAGFQNLPQSQSCRRIDFEKSDVVTDSRTKQAYLIVSGTKSWVTMTVSLVPLIYIDRPDYWAIELIACQNGFGLPQTAPFVVSLNITGVLGNKGVEVLGASTNKKHDVHL